MVLIEALAHIGLILLGVITLGFVILLIIYLIKAQRSDELGYKLFNGIIIWGGVIAGTSSLCTAVFYLANDFVSPNHSFAWIGSIIGVIIGLWAGARLYTRYTL